MGFDKKGDLTRLYIKFNDFAAPVMRKSIDKIGQNFSVEKGIQRLEKMLKQENEWEWAYIKETDTNTILHYYHHSRSTQQLNKEQYLKILQANAKVQARAYIVYTLEAKLEDPMKVKGKTIPIYENLDAFLANIKRLWSSDVLKIQIYQEKTLLCEYTHLSGVQWTKTKSLR